MTTLLTTEGQEFRVLDKAIQADASGLTVKNLVGSGRGGKELLDELCASGLMEKRSKKYLITPDGRARWEQEASPEERRKVRENEQQREKNTLIAFLDAVEKRAGKPFTDKQLAGFPERVRARACERNLVKLGSKKGSFVLAPEGETLLLAGQPIDKQIAILQEKQQEATNYWRGVQLRMRDEIAELSANGAGQFQDISEDLEKRAQQARDAFSEVLTETTAFSTLLAAGKEFQKTVESRCTTELQEAKAQLTGVREKIEEMSREQQEQLGQWSNLMTKRIDDLKRGLVGQVESQTKPNQMSTSAGNDADHKNLEKDIASFVRSWRIDRGSSCPLPDLYRFLKKRIPEMKVGGFHDLIRALHERGDVIRLAGWSGSLDRIPEPEFAIFVSNKVMYYVVSPN